MKEQNYIRQRREGHERCGENPVKRLLRNEYVSSGNDCGRNKPLVDKHSPPHFIGIQSETRSLYSQVSWFSQFFLVFHFYDLLILPTVAAVHQKSDTQCKGVLFMCTQRFPINICASLKVYFLFHTVRRKRRLLGVTTKLL